MFQIVCFFQFNKLGTYLHEYPILMLRYYFLFFYCFFLSYTYFFIYHFRDAPTLPPWHFAGDLEFLVAAGIPDLGLCRGHFCAVSDFLFILLLLLRSSQI